MLGHYYQLSIYFHLKKCFISFQSDNAHSAVRMMVEFCQMKLLWNFENQLLKSTTLKRREVIHCWAFMARSSCASVGFYLRMAQGLSKGDPLLTTNFENKRMTKRLGSHDDGNCVNELLAM